jgi:hypothetical protein
VPAKLATPWRFRERMLLFGQGGSGKTNAILTVADAIAQGEMFVVDNDYSYAYQRALQTDFESAAEKVHVHECESDWESVVDALQQAITEGLATGDPQDNWLVIDSISPTWQAVQDFITGQITGASSAEYLTQLRKESKDLTEMNRTLVDQVPWSIVNKEYAEHIWAPLRNWPGHFIITAEAKKLSRQDAEKAELADWYQHLGVQPAGQGKIHYVSATTLLMKKAKRDEYQITTVKDRNREDQENLEIDNFAMDYLREVAGWELKVVKS